MRLHILYIICLCTSCIGRQNNLSDKKPPINSIDSLYSINISPNKEEDDVKTINDIANKVELVNMEFTKESALSSLNLHLSKVSDKYIISSFRSEVMQFDTLGNFEKKVVRFGKSKSELLPRLYKHSLNSEKIVINQGRKMILVSSDKVAGYNSSKYYYNSVLLKDGSYVALPYLGCEMNSMAYLDFLDSKYCFVGSQESECDRDVYYKIPNNLSGRIESYRLAPSFDGGALFKDIFNDTIYLVSSRESMKPYIKLDYGKYAPTIKDPLAQDKIHILNMSESRDFIFIKYGLDDSVFGMG